MDLQYDLNEALTREGLSLHDIHALRKSDIPGCPKSITDKQLALFLNACDKDLEQAKKVIKLYYEAKKSMPEFFNDRDPTKESIQQCFKGQ